MSDPCYMEVTCRRQDQARFEALGFVAQDWKNDPASPAVVLVDEEANHAHCGHLPTDIPYHGHHGGGGDYGPAVLACNGRLCAEVETGHSGGYVVDWDEKRNRPNLTSLRAIWRYLRVRRQVGAELPTT